MATLGRTRSNKLLTTILARRHREKLTSGKANGALGRIAWVDGGVSFTGDFREQDRPVFVRNSPDTDDPDRDPGREINEWSLEIHSILFFFNLFISMLLVGGTELLCASTPHQWNRSIRGQIKQINENDSHWAWLSQTGNHLGFATHTIYHLCLLYHQKQIFANHTVEKTRYCCHDWMLLNALKALQTS